MKFKIYTKNGDEGKTSLVSGTNVKKNNLRVELYGEIDELNSTIGLLVANLADKNQMFKENLHDIQRYIFSLSSYIACEKSNWGKQKLPELNTSIVSILEQEIDSLCEEVGPLDNFILPGGSNTSAICHVCRCVARRCERRIVNFLEVFSGELPRDSLIFINRLSDYFFVLGRMLGKNDGEVEVVWKA